MRDIAMNSSHQLQRKKLSNNMISEEISAVSSRKAIRHAQFPYEKNVYEDSYGYR